MYLYKSKDKNGRLGLPGQKYFIMENVMRWIEVINDLRELAGFLNADREKPNLIYLKMSVAG